VLKYHRNRSASTTASASQVRQKVSTSSVGQWQHFAQELAPLRKRLEHAGIDCAPLEPGSADAPAVSSPATQADPVARGNST
jgi:hypothetical protein